MGITGHPRAANHSAAARMYDLNLPNTQPSSQPATGAGVITGQRPTKAVPKGPGDPTRVGTTARSTRCTRPRPSLRLELTRSRSSAGALLQLVLRHFNVNFRFTKFV